MDARPLHNAYLSGSMPRLFLRTAGPLVFVMAANGLQTVIDGYFLGIFVGADALAAVTLMFPLFMFLNAIATLVSTGTASELARQLGAGDLPAARRSFVSAHILSILICIPFVAGFAWFGPGLVAALANGSPRVADMSFGFMSILVWASPLQFALSLHGAALRCEGRLAFMAIGSLVLSFANIGFNYLLIVLLDQGVAGAAIGTVCAQGIAVLAFVLNRAWSRPPMRWPDMSFEGWNTGWGRVLALGAPQSLSFIGFSLTSAATIAALQIWQPAQYDSTIAALGIANRVFSFAFLLLFGLAMAMQAIVGNNYGAALFDRSDAGLRLSLVVSTAFCALVEAFAHLGSGWIGRFFVDDPAAWGQLARLMPYLAALYVINGPILMITSYYQAIGDARRSALIGLTRLYLFSIPLTFALPLFFGETGIWLSGPLAGVLQVALTAVVLLRARSATGLRWGLFHGSRGRPAGA